MSNFFSHLNQVARRWPGSIAFSSSGGNMDYGAFIQNIENIAQNAINRGMKPGETVHIACGNPEVLFLLVIGMMRAGMTVGVTRQTSVYRSHGFELDNILYDSQTNRPKEITAGKWIQLSPDWFQPPKTKKRSLPRDPDYALIFSSSASTGLPKLIFASRRTMESRLTQKSGDPFYTGTISLISTTGSVALSSFNDYMITLMKGGLIVRIPQRSARAILDAICIYRPTYLTISPFALVDTLKTLSQTPRQFEKVKYLRITGAYCAPGVRKKAASLLAEHVITSYGATEISRVAWGDFNDIGATENSVGYIVPGATVETVDDAGNPLQEGMEGELRIKPANGLACSYTGVEAKNVLEDGWFYPGDYGRVDESGQLIFLGRKSTIINIGGNKINPEVAESVLVEFPGVDEAAVGSERSKHGYQTICALIVGSQKCKLGDINEFLAKNKKQFTVNRQINVKTIPYTKNGKIDRPAVQNIIDGQ